MKARASVLALLALVALALTMTGCDEPLAPTPIPQGNVTVVQNVTVGTQPNPSASPSPGAGTCVREAIDSVRVNPFGYDCAAGVVKPPNSSGLLPAGCTALVTATPKGPGGEDLPISVHGSQITWSTPLGSDRIVVTPNPEQPFNQNVRMREGSAPGEFQLAAVVCGVGGSWNGRTVP